jgi:thiaminase
MVPDLGHSLVVDSGWRDVAVTSLRWLKSTPYSRGDLKRGRHGVLIVKRGRPAALGRPEAWGGTLRASAPRARSFQLTTYSSAAELVSRTRDELAGTAEAIRSHRFLELLRARAVPDERLRALAGEQNLIVSSDRRSFAQLAARFPSGLAGRWFLGMAEGEGVALDLLRGLTGWLGVTDEQLQAYEPRPGAQAYPAFVAWLALNGSRADVVLAFLANLAAWGENCAQVAAALRESYGAPDEAVGFFDFFANPPADFEPDALAVLDEALEAGDSPLHGRRATRLLQSYELSFWDALAEGL